MKLNNIIQEKYNDILSSAGKAYAERDLAKAIGFLEEAWELLPDGKYEYDESFMVARQLVRLNLLSKNVDSARIWAIKLQSCDPERADIGEKEFMLGKVLFELGELEEAKKYLIIANRKSLGRCFGSEDKKYKAFIK